MTKSKDRKSAGFSLIELLIVLAIIGILIAWALPSYRDSVVRGNLVTATNALSATRVQMEQYFQDNRTYAAVTTPVAYSPPCTLIAASAYTPFTVTCAAASLSATTYTITATGNTGSVVAGFAYSIDQNGNQKTTALPANFGVSVPQNCWITKKGSTC